MKLIMKRIVASAAVLISMISVKNLVLKFLRYIARLSKNPKTPI